MLALLETAVLASRPDSIDPMDRALMESVAGRARSPDPPGPPPQEHLPRNPHKHKIPTSRRGLDVDQYRITGTELWRFRTAEGKPMPVKDIAVPRPGRIPLEVAIDD